MQVRSMLLVSLFAALMAVSSLMSVPLAGGVPFTLQVIVVMLAGFCLGPVYGAVRILVWVLLRVMGLPVFGQGTAGFLVFIRPTGGFIMGFVCCAGFVGYLTTARPIGFIRTFLAMLAGLTVIYIMGYIGFMVSFEYVLNSPLPWGKGLLLAVLPFIPGLGQDAFCSLFGCEDTDNIETGRVITYLAIGGLVFHVAGF